MIQNTTNPQLFFSAQDLPQLRRLYAEDARFTVMRESLESFDRKAETVFLESEVNLEDQCHHIRQVCDVMQNMAFHFLMTGDESARDLAFFATRTLMKFPCWDFFISKGKVLGVQGAPRGAIAMAAVIDWLGDEVDPTERQQWLQALAEKGCEPCYLSLLHIRHPRQATDWEINRHSVMFAERSAFPTDSSRRPEITKDTNLRAAPAGGLCIGVAAIHLFGEGANLDLERWLEMGTHALKVFNDIYQPDGSYGEGVNYGNYTSESIFMAVEALRRAGFEDLSAGINWSGNVQFMLNMAMPTHENPYEVVNIGDSGRHRGRAVFQHPDGRAESRSALAFWVAKNYRDASAQWFGENLAAAHNIWSLAFFDDSVKAVAPGNQAQTWYCDLDWVVARTGFRAEDLQVSLRSGIGWNHEHADRNSIIVKAHGEQLIVDPSRPPYPFTDPNWMMRTTAGHSAILIDGAGHYYHNGVEGTCATHAQARLVAQGEGRGASYFVSDATQAYRLVDLNIKSVVRAVIVFFELETVIVVDRVTKWHHASKVEARFFADNWEGDATIETSDGGFTITRPGVFAATTLFARDAITVNEGKLPIPAERAAKHPFVAVETEPTMATTLVNVMAIGKTGQSPAKVAIEADPDRIVVKINSDQGATTCRIDDRDLVPDIEIEA